MGDGANKRLNAYGAYAVIAGCGAAASALIVFIVMHSLSFITDTGMVAVTAMAAAPALMAVGVAYFVHKTAALPPTDASATSDAGRSGTSDNG